MSLDIKQNLGKGCNPLAIDGSKQIKHIEINPNQPSIILLADGSKSVATCIHCPDQPCVSYAPSEIDSELANKFRVDSSSDVCATNAIKWIYESSQPAIASEDCIFCGVCVSRCPTQAIYLSQDGAKLATQPQKLFTTETGNGHSETRKLLHQTLISGAHLNESDALISEILDRFKKLGGRAAKLSPNLLTRNLFRTLGVPAEAYPQGVQYSTVDVLFRAGDIHGAIEVEFSSAVIDVPRNLAGDVAVLIARHGLHKSKLETYSVVCRLPQGREQYWMVVDDMEKVLGLKIRTASIVSLYLLVWARNVLDVQDDNLLLSENHGISLRPFLEKKLKRKINLTEGFENQLEPSKLVE